MKLFVVLVPFILAIVISWGIFPYIFLIAYKKRLFDAIDIRKSHKNIIPRLGGVAFMPIQYCIFFITILLVAETFNYDINIELIQKIKCFTMLICGLIILYVVGIADDLIGINYKIKFFAQVFVACLFPLAGLWINDLYGLGFIVSLPPWIGMPITVFVVVLIINAINLMDGLDGLCSALIGMGCIVLGILFLREKNSIEYSIFAFITAGVMITFFYYNVYGTIRRSRQIFMGDTGSMTLGYSIAFLAISFAMNNSDIKSFSEGAIVVAFSTLVVPILDVARVMFVRFKSKKHLFLPDRNHLHHKFLDAGFSHKKSMIIILGLALFFCIFNIFMVEFISNNIVIVLDLILWGVFNYLLEKKLKRIATKEIEYSHK